MTDPFHSGGVLISFEGIDCSGKTSNVPYLKKLLEEKGFTVITTREIGGTPAAEKIRNILINDVLDPVSEILLCYAARLDHVKKVILPALRNGTVVISDRFLDSTHAFQGGGRHRLQEVCEIEAIALKGFEPTYTFFFDVTLEEGVRRMSDKVGKDKFEQEQREFHQRVFDGYQRCYRENPLRIFRIDAMQTKEDVHQQIKRWVDDVFVIKHPLQ